MRPVFRRIVTYLSLPAVAGIALSCTPRGVASPPPTPVILPFTPEVGELTAPDAIHLGIPRVAVDARVSTANDSCGVNAELATRSRAVLDQHPDVTTDVDWGRALLLPIASIDTSAQCQLRELSNHVAIDCALRFAVSGDRGRLVSTWQRRVSLTASRHEPLAALVAIAVDRGVQNLPERMLGSLESAGELR